MTLIIVRTRKINQHKHERDACDSEGAQKQQLEKTHQNRITIATKSERLSNECVH